MIDDPQAIADMIDDDVRPISDEKCPPQIEGSEERLRSRCYDKAHEIYGARCRRSWSSVWIVN